MTYSPWQKHLGFTLKVIKEERAVEKSCLPYLERLRDEYLAETTTFDTTQARCGAEVER